MDPVGTSNWAVGHARLQAGALVTEESRESTLTAEEVAPLIQPVWWDSASANRSPVVRDVDDEPVAVAGSGQREDSHRKPSADADPDGRVPLEASAVGDLTERRVAR